MTHYLIMASDLPALEGRPLKAGDVFNLMRDHCCWAVPESNQQAKLKEGDQLFFYLGSKVKHIVAQGHSGRTGHPHHQGKPHHLRPQPLPLFRLKKAGGLGR